MRAPFSGLRLAELGAQRHQARHLGLGDGDFLAAPLGEADVLDLVIGEGGRHSGLLEAVEKFAAFYQPRPPGARHANPCPYWELWRQIPYDQEGIGRPGRDRRAAQARAPVPVHWLQVSISV